MRHLIPALLLVLLPLTSFAEARQPNARETAKAITDMPVNKSSDASFDKRLPPVLPGERVNDNGKDMRVWSTSGSVSTGEAPEPWKDRQMIDDFVMNKGIIVDTRRNERPIPPRDGVPPGAEKK